MYAHHPLQVKCHAHFHKHISAVRGFIVDTEARVDAMTLRRLDGKHTVLDAIVRIGARADIHRTPASRRIFHPSSGSDVQ